MVHLPLEIWRRIYIYDSTYHDVFKQVLGELDSSCVPQRCSAGYGMTSNPNPYFIVKSYAVGVRTYVCSLCKMTITVNRTA